MLPPLDDVGAPGTVGLGAAVVMVVTPAVDGRMLLETVALGAAVTRVVTLAVPAALAAPASTTTITEAVAVAKNLFMTLSID